jgi:hypothetical protein
VQPFNRPTVAPTASIAPPAPVVVTAPVARPVAVQAAPQPAQQDRVGVEMVERTVRFTVPSTEAMLPANLFRASMAAGIVAAAAPTLAAPAAAPAERDDQLALDFTPAQSVVVATSPLKPTTDFVAAAPRVIDIVAEDVAYDDEFAVIDLDNDPSSADVVATARRFARVPAE